MPWMDKWPSWMGGLPALATFIMVAGYIIQQWVKNRPTMQQQEIDERRARSSTYQGRITTLENQVRECHERSERREAELQGEIDLLKDKINNEAMQRVQSEISLVNTLIQIVPADELKKILTELENRQIRLVTIRQLEAKGAEGNDDQGE